MPSPPSDCRTCERRFERGESLAAQALADLWAVEPGAIMCIERDGAGDFECLFYARTLRVGRCGEAFPAARIALADFEQ